VAEFPEGGVTVSLDGGSHFYEQDVVKDALHTSLRLILGRSRVALVRGTSISPPSIRWRVASLILQCALRRNRFREHAPSESYSVAFATQRDHGHVHFELVCYATARLLPAKPGLKLTLGARLRE
jgi:hypothetical protein